MYTSDMVKEVNDMVRQHVLYNMTPINANQAGLDIRCGRIYIDRECIAIFKHSDYGLQYYGGFEYVSKSERKELGDYVFYFGEDSDRVQSHIDTYYYVEEEEQ